MSSLEDRLMEVEERVEELEEKVEESNEGDEESERKTLYVQVYYVEETVDSMFGEMERPKYLVVEEDGGYNLPNEKEAQYASTTRQVISIVQSLGIDGWKEVEKKGAKPDAIYYRVKIRKEDANLAERGMWASRERADEIITDRKGREYL